MHDGLDNVTYVINQHIGRQILTSLMNGIRSALETKPGTSWDVVTSDLLPMNVRTFEHYRNLAFSTGHSERTRFVQSLSRRL